MTAPPGWVPACSGTRSKRLRVRQSLAADAHLFYVVAPAERPTWSRGAVLVEKWWWRRAPRPGLSDTASPSDDQLQASVAHEAKANHSMTRRKRMDDIKTGESRCPGISPAVTCLLARRCPALRWRELGSALMRNLGTWPPIPFQRFNWVKSPPAGESETPKWQKPQGAE